MDELGQVALLRKHEPVLRFNRGERFFPMDVATFVKNASLWVRRQTGAARCVAREGSLSLDSLAQVPAPEPGATLFLRNAVTMSAREIARHAFEDRRASAEDPRDTFRAGRGRLARVGYTSRLVDALFSLSLLARGRVPGDLATAAAVAYQMEMRNSEVYRYYGRVTNCGDWLVLQYWFFYFFNDWRTRFFGTNDHEGDWEAVSIFLGSDGKRGWKPEWIACSCHEYPGAELRRHWDDSEVQKQGGHPVIHVGAGSHAGYYRAGDYLAEVDLPVLAPVSRFAETVQNFWRDKLNQYAPGESGPGSHPADAPTPAPDSSGLSVPFVDYARGDGHALGPGENRQWSEPMLISSPPPWVRDYRGLWGYYARDPLSGEDAPPGPMYDRAGAARLPWQDPVSWCGLSSTPPREKAAEFVIRMRDELLARRERRQGMIARIRDRLMSLGVEAHVAEPGERKEGWSPKLRQRREHLQTRLTKELTALAEEDDTLHRLLSKAALTRVELPMRAHLRRLLQPISDESHRLGRIAEIWAALGVGALLLALVVLALLAPEQLVKGAFVLLSWVVVIEAFLRNRLTRLVTFVAVSLTLICSFVLIVEFHRLLAIALAVGVGLFLLRENLRELWS